MLTLVWQPVWLVCRRPAARLLLFERASGALSGPLSGPHLEQPDPASLADRQQGPAHRLAALKQQHYRQQDRSGPHPEQ